MAQDNTVRINTQTLRDTAAYVSDRNEQLEKNLLEIKTKVARLCDSSWQSDAGEEIQRKIETFANNHFKQYKDVVATYCKFLVETAERYETTEATIQGNASGFQQ